MSPKVKNIVMVFGLGIILVVLYLIFSGSKKEEAGLVSSAPSSQVVGNIENTVTSQTTSLGNEYLPLLLNIQKLNLNDSLFAKEAFMVLEDNTSSIYDANPQTGRPNPFAPVGSDNFISPFDSVQNPFNVPANIPPQGTNNLSPELFLQNTPNQ